MLGFAVVTHTTPAQFLRLARTLTQMYGNPPIACHHDFSQAALDTSAFPPNVSFVEDWHKTRWGVWPIVEATLKAIRLLYARDDPDYFTVVSAADYPIAPAKQVLWELREWGADAYIDGYSLQDALQGRFEPCEAHLKLFRAPYNIEEARNRYLRAIAKVPLVKKSNTIGRRWRVGSTTRAMPFDTPVTPYTRDYHCFVGSNWFSGNRKAAQRLLARTQSDRRLQRHLRWRRFPEESYFQTVLWNDPDIRTDHRTRHYMNWESKEEHPKTLSEEDLHVLFDELPHFARKFSADAPVLDAIDEKLGVAPAKALP